jgi:hypothetical protein
LNTFSVVKSSFNDENVELEDCSSPTTGKVKQPLANIKITSKREEINEAI